MATSGNYDFTSARDMIIQNALRMVGALGQGENPTASQISEAAISLNMFMKYLSTKGLVGWAVKSRDVILIANTNSYSLGGTGGTDDKPLKIYSVLNRVIATNYDIPMTDRAQKDYYESFSNKTANGSPVNYYYDRGRGSGTLYVYPTPDATLAASNKLVVIYQRPIQDFDAAGDDVDAPAEWIDVIQYGLAMRLAPIYGLERFTRSQLKNDYKEMFREASGFDQEPSSVFLQPNYEGR